MMPMAMLCAAPPVLMLTLPPALAMWVPALMVMAPWLLVTLTLAWATAPRLLPRVMLLTASSVSAPPKLTPLPAGATLMLLP